MTTFHDMYVSKKSRSATEEKHSVMMSANMRSLFTFAAILETGRRRGPADCCKSEGRWLDLHSELFKPLQKEINARATQSS